jgi:hypothetical protein
MRFDWAQVSNRLDERFTLTHVGWAPAIWVEVDDRSTLPDYYAKRVTGVRALEGEHQWQIKGVCRRKGVFTHDCGLSEFTRGFLIENVDVRDGKWSGGRCSVSWPG